MTAALAIDIGGTKLLCALVEDGRVLDQVQCSTDRGAGPRQWLDAAARAAEDWSGRYSSVGLAVTGGISEGLWFALNVGTLDVPSGTPIVAMAEDRFGVPSIAVNDAQAAAWGEYLFGAGRGRDLIYITISTGIGGGAVSGGRLLQGRSGLAGHVGQMRGLDGAELVEERASGRWLAAAARELGHETDARGVFRAADEGNEWAVELRGTGARRAAALCADLQMLLDPEAIILGGGVGLAPGFLALVRAELMELPPLLAPFVVASQLKDCAGVVGAGALAAQLLSETKNNDQAQQENKRC